MNAAQQTTTEPDVEREVLRRIWASGLLARTDVDHLLEREEEFALAGLRRRLSILPVLAALAIMCWAAGTADAFLWPSFDGFMFAEAAARDAHNARFMSAACEPLLFGGIVAVVVLGGHAILARLVERRVAHLAQQRAGAKLAFEALRSTTTPHSAS